MASAKTSVAKKATGGALVHAQSFQDELDALKSRLAAPTGNKIKISDKQFKMPSGDILDFLDIVVVDFVYANSYYAGAYVEGEFSAPDCFAIAVEPNALAPSPNAADCQTETGACKGCWANEFASKGKGKACQNRLKIAILPTDATAETPFTILDISPTAIKGFSTYVQSVARGHQLPPYAVVTHVECNPATKYDVAVFSLSETIEDMDFVQMVRGRKEEARELLLTEPDFSSMAANDTKPAKGKSALKAPARRRA